jgi:hypothetical protein
MKSLFSLAIALCASLSFAQSGGLNVDAKSNIFGYGVGNPDPGGGGGGLVAPTVSLNAGTGRTITFTAGGSAGWAGSLVNGPDGGSFAANTNVPALGPISGYSGPLSGMLVGLFIEAGDISGFSAPGTLSYPNVSAYGQASYSPGLRQVFFIGDGLTGTGSGAQQVFSVPNGASKLVLGIADAFGFNGAAGYYNDNVGSYDVRYAAVPEPSTLIALGSIMAGLRLRKRRQSR